MSFDLNNMKTDVKKELDGSWIDYPGGLRLKIARLNNQNHQSYLLDRRREIEQDKRFGPQDQISREDLRKISIEALADCVLLGWECMVEGGEVVAYNRENAIRILTQVPEFFRLVEGESTDIENYRNQRGATESGNSSSSESGTGDGEATSPNSEQS